MIKKAFLLAVLSLPVALLGYGYPASLETGTSLVGLDAVTASLGGATSLDLGGSLVLQNPSGLALLRTSRIQASVGTVLTKESVETPYGLFNISDIAAGPIGLTAAFPLLDGLGAGFGFARLSDFSYTGEFYDYLIEGVDTVVVFEQQNNSGSFWEASAGLGSLIIDGLYAGASVGYRFGSGTSDYFHDTSIDTAYSIVDEWDESGIAYRAGLTAVISRARFGATYASELDRYPSRASFGFALGDMTLWEPVIGGEVELRFPDDSTTYVARVFGGTLLSGNEFYGRASVFMFKPAGGDTKQGTGLSLGVSLKVAARMTVDAAFSWTTENRSGTVFGGYSDQTTVTDTNSGITAGITWNP